MGKPKWLAGTAWTAVAAMLVAAAFTSANAAAAQASGPSNAELEQRIDELESEIQQAQMSSATQNQQQDDSIDKLNKTLSGWWNDTKISGRMYYDLSWIDQKSDGVKQPASGYGFDIKRFYVGIDHNFNDMFSADVTTDFTYDSGAGATQIYIKKAYLQAKLSDALTFRFGATDLPWIPFDEGVYGYRYVENTLIDRTKFGTSSDWGVHALGNLASGLISYDLAVVDGAGYKHPFRSDSMDFEGRVNLNFDNFIVGVGGYDGKLGKDVEGASTYHTASRFDALAAYKTKVIDLGVEYFKAWDWNEVTSTSTDSADGVGAFASYKFTPQWGVFGRYDHVEPSQDLSSSTKDNYFNVGISWTPTKIIDFALVYKHDKVDDGFESTSNGTIGGVNDGTYNEVGIFSDFQW